MESAPVVVGKRNVKQPAGPVAVWHVNPSIHDLDGKGASEGPHGCLAIMPGRCNVLRVAVSTSAVATDSQHCHPDLDPVDDSRSMDLFLHDHVECFAATGYILTMVHSKNRNCVRIRALRILRNNDA